MMILVIGGSGSGKSSYAEGLAVSLAESGNIKKYYLATMQVCDAEGRQKVGRHRKLRSGKGFFTIEQPTEIHRAIEKMERGERVALLECISNLTANEMFSEGETKSEMQVVENVIRGIESLNRQMTHLVVVSNNVFEDGIIYDASTIRYIRAIGEINQRLAALADQVVEVVVGIPVVIQ